MNHLAQPAMKGENVTDRLHLLDPFVTRQIPALYFLNTVQGCNVLSVDLNEPQQVTFLDAFSYIICGVSACTFEWFRNYKPKIYLLLYP